MNEELAAILRDMQAESDAADEASGTADYHVHLINLALIARHYLRTLAASTETREP